MIPKEDILEIIKETICGFIEESEYITDQDELLLRVNKELCKRIREYE